MSLLRTLSPWPLWLVLTAAGCNGDEGEGDTDAVDTSDSDTGEDSDTDSGEDSDTDSGEDSDTDSGEDSDPDDLDGDGYTPDEGDCDEGDAEVHPGADETCDERDNDCDDLVDDDDSDLSGGTTYYEDADSDGFGDPESTRAACELPPGYVEDNTDCEDADAEISPSGIETCDEFDTDENCDGLADDASATDPSTWYEDTDGDTFGVAGSTTEACDLPDGYADNDQDCDDDNAAINPDAREVCDPDDTDEDCDTVADDADSSTRDREKITYYLDADGDGYGLSTSSTTVCDLPSGYVLASTDCDDAEVTVYPDAPTVCADALVNDCDGDEEEELDDCVLSGDLTGDDAEALRVGKSSGDAAGSSVAGGGDVDADGFDDLWVGAPSVSTTRGAVYLLGGPLSTGTETIGDSGVYTAWIKGGSADEELGTSVDCAGDLDSDGYADAVLGGPGTGVAYLVHGPVAGSGSVSTMYDAKLIRSAAGDEAGVWVAGMGDLDGDGNDDVAVGADHLDYSAADAGGAYLVLGPTDGASLYLSDAAEALLYGEVTLDYAGHRVAAAGDFNGDDERDVLVGAPGANGGKTDSGSAYLLLGEISGEYALSDANLILRGEAASDAAGSAADGGADVNGDAYADIVVGSPGNDEEGTEAGAAYVVFGSSSFSPTLTLSSADIVIYGGSSGDALGTSVAMDDDASRDGTADLLVGASGSDAVGAGSGAAYLFTSLESGSLSASDAVATFSSDSAGDALGSAVALAGDTRGDGTLGVLLGATGLDASSTTTATGGAYLFVGEIW